MKSGKLALVLFAVASTSVASVGAARAADSAKPAKKIVAVTDLKVLGTVDPKAFDGVGAQVRQSLAKLRPDLEIVENKDGIKRDYVATLEAGSIGGQWLVTSTVLVVADLAPLKRWSKKVKDPKALDAVWVDCAKEFAEAVPK